MSMKYIVASRTMVSKRLGMPIYLLALDLLALNQIIENARTSMKTQWGGEHQNSWGEMVSEVGR